MNTFKYTLEISTMNYKITTLHQVLKKERTIYLLSGIRNRFVDQQILNTFLCVFSVDKDLLEYFKIERLIYLSPDSANIILNKKRRFYDTSSIYMQLKQIQRILLQH